MGGRSWKLSAVLILATMLAGVGLRFGRFGLPYVAVKYGGSMCWALLIYWVVSSVVRRMAWPAGLAAMVATGIEFFKLYRSPRMDAFRLTIPGTLVLGRYFSWRDILAYWVAIALGTVLDATLRDRQTKKG